MATSDFLFDDKSGDMPALRELGIPQALNNLGGATQQAAPRNPNELGVGQWLGLALEGFTSGFQGRAPQGMNILMKQQEMMQQQKEKERQFKLQEDAISQHKFENFPKNIQAIRELGKILTPKQKTEIGPSLSEWFDNASGIKFGQSFVNGIFENPTKADAIVQIHGLLRNAPKEMVESLATAIEKNPENTDKILAPLAVQQAHALMRAGQQVPPELATYMNDDQRAQFQLPLSSAEKVRQEEKAKGSKPAHGSLMQQIYSDAAHAQALKQFGNADSDEFKIAKAGLLQQFMNNPESFPNIAAKTARELWLKDHPGDEKGAVDAAGAKYLEVTGQVALNRAEKSAEGRGIGQQTPAAQAGATAIATASKEGTIQGERNKPLGERATNYINPDSLTAAQPNMTEQDAIDKGYRSFKGANSAQFVTMSRSAMNILNRLETLSQKLLPKATGNAVQDAINVRTNQAKLAALQQSRDPEVREFNALLASNLAQFAKAAGDAANIAVPEQEFQRDALPKTSDTRESAKQLIQSKKAIMRGVLEGALGIRGVAPQSFPGQGGGPKVLTKELAIQFKRQAGGDSAKARKLAKDQGYEIPSE